MYRSVIFVHGTGVRGERFKSTVEAVREGLQSRAQELDVRGCYWGDAHGARLHLGGLSVPGYSRAQGGRESTADREVARWAVLYVDPWHELRLLQLGAEAEADDEGAFVDAVETYRPSAQTVGVLRSEGLEPYFEHALSELRRSEELHEAAGTIDAGGFSHRSAVARGLVAYTLVAAERDGRQTIVGSRRETLLSHVVGDLDAQDKGVVSSLKRVASAIASPVATWYGQQHRGSISDGATPLMGDILRYQVHGGALRDQIADAVEKAPGQAVTLLGHSLGGVACVEMLIAKGRGKVDQLITVGSQASYFYEIDALSALRFGQPLPMSFPARWLNVLDEKDLLSYAAQGVFPDRVQDLYVDNGQPFIESHSAYWSNPEVWTAVTAWIG